MLMFAKITVDLLISQMNLQAHVLFLIADVSDPPSVPTDFHPTWHVSGNHNCLSNVVGVMH